MAIAADPDSDQIPGIEILREISGRIPSNLRLNVDTLTMTATTVNLGGTIGSIDVVQKLQMALETSPAFASVKVNMITADLKQLTFKLTIVLAKPLDRIFH